MKSENKIFEDLEVNVKNNPFDTKDQKNNEIITLQGKEIETLKTMIISLQNTIKESKIQPSNVSLEKPIDNLEILPGQIHKLKIPSNDLILDEEALMFSSHHEPPRKIIWPFSENELTTNINLTQSETETASLNFKKECIFNDSDTDDLNIKICSKKISAFVHFNYKIDLEDLEVNISSSNGI